MFIFSTLPGAMTYCTKGNGYKGVCVHTSAYVQSHRFVMIKQQTRYGRAIVVSKCSLIESILVDEQYMNERLSK